MTTVSIICPYRNSRHLLPVVVSNVLLQKYIDWELILIDDCSSDGGAGVAAELSGKDARIRCLTSPIRGQGEADGPWWPRNHGIACSKGRLIAFLDVDDLWHPCKLENQVLQLERTGSDMGITGYARFREDKFSHISWRLPPARVGYLRLQAGNVIPLLTVLVRREFITHGFKPSSHEDYLFWLDTFRIHRDIICTTVPELLAFHRRHKDNLTGSRLSMAAWTYVVFRNHGYSKLSSLAILIPWFANQLMQQLQAFSNPINCTLCQALKVSSPISLPPRRKFLAHPKAGRVAEKI